MTVSDNTIEAESLFRYLGREGQKVTKEMAKPDLKNHGRALDITPNIATAATSRNPKASLSTLPDVIKFYHTGERLYLGKFL